MFGTHAIAAYVFSELLASALWVIRVGPKLSLSRWIFAEIHRAVPDLAMASLVYSVLLVGVCWVAVYGLYRRRIFLRV